MFTCATDTGELTWLIGELTVFFNSISESNSVTLSIYDFKLINTTGMIFISTVIIDSVHLVQNGTVISCSDNAIPQISNTALQTVIVAGDNKLLYVY